MSGAPVLRLALARLRRRRADAVLTAVAALVAVGMLLTGAVTTSSITPSFTAQADRLGAPQLLVTAEPGAGAAATLRGVDGVARVGAELPSGTGVAGSGGSRLPVLVTVGSPAATPWLTVTSSVPAGAVGDVAVEAGLAGSLGVRAGSPLVIAGSTGGTTLRVSRVVGDLSRDRYPLTTPGAVYLSAAAARRAHIDTTRVTVPVWTSPGASLSAVAGRAATSLRASAAGASIAAVANSVTGLGLLSQLTSSAGLLFGVLALVCLVLWVLATTRLRVLVDERELGQLLATGWRPRQLRAVLVVERGLPILAGIAAGAVAGTLAARWLTGRVTEQFGAPAHLTGVVAAVAAVAVVVLATVLGSVVIGTAALGRTPAAALLRGGLSARRSPRAVDAPRTPAGLGVVLVRARPGRSLLAGSVTAIAVAVAVAAVAASATLGSATRSPRAWGLDYTYRLGLPSGASAADLLPEVRAVDGVRTATPLTEGTLHAGAAVVSSPAQLLPISQTALRPQLITGTLPRTSGQVAIGTALADEIGARAGDSIPLSSSRGTVTVTVSGTVRALGSSGLLVLGTPALAPLLPAEASSVLVSADAGARPALAALSGGRIAVTSAADEIALPFASTLRWVLTGLAVGLLVLAGVVALTTAAATAAEQTRTFGLLRALGGRGTVLARVGIAYGAAVTVPGLVVGTVLGLLLARLSLAAATSSLGGVPVTIPAELTALAVAGTAAVVAAAFLGPLLSAVRRAPAVSMRTAAAVAAP